jgi:hypothetical protein
MAEEKQIMNRRQRELVKRVVKGYLPSEIVEILVEVYGFTVVWDILRSRQWGDVAIDAWTRTVCDQKK